MSALNHWMPLYVNDYLGDTQHLGTAEHGAYLLLLMHSWKTGPLPDDDRQLARIARTDMPSWKRMAKTIRAFFRAADGALVQPRLEKIREKQTQVVVQRRLAGIASAGRRKAQRAANEDGTYVGSPLARRAGKAKAEQEEVPSLREGPPASPPHAGPALSPPDARTMLFGEGMERVMRLTGKPQRAARGLLGQWLKVADDDAALVNLTLIEAEQMRPADPVAWILAALQFRTGQRPGQRTSSPLDGWVAMARDNRPTFDVDVDVDVDVGGDDEEKRK